MKPYHKHDCDACVYLGSTMQNRKRIKITLVYQGRDGSYVVTQVLNSVRWVPGQNLTQQDVKALAESPIEVAVVGK